MSHKHERPPEMITFQTLRKAVGWLGVLLPAGLLLSNYLITGCTYVEFSISQYYFTAGGDMLVAVLCVVGIFLLSYHGYTVNEKGEKDNTDNISSSIAGIAAIAVAISPTNMVDVVYCKIFSLGDNSLRNGIHYGSAVVFFVTLAYISIFRFTKSGPEKTPEKKMRNRIYLACGIAMVACLVVILLIKVKVLDGEKFLSLNPVFWLEWVALFAFGFAWLIKGELILKDKKTQQKQHA